MADHGPGADGPDELSNWGRWGERDIRGTLNLITDEARQRGAAQAQLGRTVSMAFPIKPVSMSAPLALGDAPMPSPVLQTLTWLGPMQRSVTDVLLITTHHAKLTHVDALVHVPIDDSVYPGVPLAEAVAFGAVHHAGSGAFVDGVVTRGVLLDLSPGDRLPENHEVSANDLEAAEARQGVQVESGDALLVRGGWTLSDNPFANVPWMSLDAVRWMHERGVSIYGGDIGDRPPFPPGRLMAMHGVALAKLGMPLIDNVDVDAVAELCSELNRHSFLFVLGTLPVTGATGLPVNPLAIF